MNCKQFQDELPDLILTHGARPSLAAVAHMKICPPCSDEYRAFESTFGLLDSWKAPEPSPYFDQKLAVRLREEQAAPRMGLFEQWRTRLLFNTGRNFRPAMAGALAFTLLVGIGGGGFAGLHTFNVMHPPQASAAIQDLQILDRNQQAFDQLDELQADEENEAAPVDQGQPPAESDGPRG